MKIEAVVFDMDGVLFDTERLYMDGWCQVAKKRGIRGMEEVAVECIGLNSHDTRQLVLERFGQDFAYVEFRNAVSAWLKTRIKIYGLPIKPGVHKILTYLQQKEIPMGLASSTSYHSVLDHLKVAGIVDYFKVIVAGDMIEHAKPQPDIYFLTCRKMGVDPANVIAIEDSPNGIKSAHDAGAKVIMVPDLITPDEELRKMTFGICSDLGDVVRFLEQYN
ncbi:MAG: HAD family phosphatase [Lachnospiraceae bacterium]|nr:HAD family phosphatase [Lachnospiraceae bacterium]